MIGRLITAYRPSEPHGWPAGPGQELGVTIGGHVPSRDFTQDGGDFRISLLPFGQTGDAPDPVYEAEPTDPDINFKQTLVDTFGEFYSFRYAGGLRPQERFRVHSYSVFVIPESEFSPLGYGADLYVVYEPGPGRNDSVAHGTLLWIRAIRRVRPDGATESYVDNIGGTHPFTETGGRTSIFGEQVVNLDYIENIERLPDDPRVTPETFMAEVFLVRDTRVKDQTGRDVVNVLGGIKYGWQVEER